MRQRLVELLSVRCAELHRVDDKEPFAIQSDGENLERRFVFVIAEVEGAVVRDRRPRRRRLIEDEAAVSDDELDLSLCDAVFERRFCKDKVHIRRILYDKTTLTDD